MSLTSEILRKTFTKNDNKRMVNHADDYGLETDNLFAVGECASMYHGANRLGGNSLLAAVYSGMVAAEEMAGRAAPAKTPDFAAETETARRALNRQLKF